MEEQNAPIFTHAKMEYTNQLIDILTPQLFDGIKSIYDEAIKVNGINYQPILVLFRKFLEKVPTWSSVILETEADRIIKCSECDWLDDLITAVFISHTKILTSIGTNISNANIDVTIPKTINFIHKTYINVAREIWKNPYLYNSNVPASEYQQNMRTVEMIIKESIENTVRNLLPIKEILKQHLDTYDTNNYEAQKKLASNDLRQMLFDEIKSLNLGKLLIQSNEDDYVKVDNSQSQNENNDDDENNDHENNDDYENNDGDENNDHEKNDDDENNDDENNDGNENNDYENNEDENNDDENNDNDEKINMDENNDDDEKINMDEKIEPIENIIEPVNDYESPDEEEIQKKCSNLEINTIPDVTEEKYDNVEIVKKEEKKDLSLLETFIQSLSNDNKKKELKEKQRLETERVEKERIERIEKERVENDKINIEKEKEKKRIAMEEERINIEKVRLEEERIENERINMEKERLDKERINMEKERLDKERLDKERLDKERLDKERIEKEKMEKEKMEKEKMEKEKERIAMEENDVIKPLKEVISVDKQIDDTETVDDFFNDVSKLMENKGINVNKEAKTYTLFDDAIDEEN